MWLLQTCLYGETRYPHLTRVFIFLIITSAFWAMPLLAWCLGTTNSQLSKQWTGAHSCGFVRATKTVRASHLLDFTLVCWCYQVSKVWLGSSVVPDSHDLLSSLCDIEPLFLARDDPGGQCPSQTHRYSCVWSILSRATDGPLHRVPNTAQG